MPRRTLIAVSSAALAGALSLGSLASPAGAAAKPAKLSVYEGKVTKLKDSPFAGATAYAELALYRNSTIASIYVEGIDPKVAGQKFGVHLHSGPCTAGNGDAAGPHYNKEKENDGKDKPSVNNRTEVWLDFKVDKGGGGAAQVTVPFLPKDGVRSIVIHEKVTMPDGMAGGRWACVPMTIG